MKVISSLLEQLETNLKTVSYGGNNCGLRCEECRNGTELLPPLAATLQNKQSSCQNLRDLITCKLQASVTAY